jgi:hypothetical protein
VLKKRLKMIFPDRSRIMPAMLLLILVILLPGLIGISDFMINTESSAEATQCWIDAPLDGSSIPNKSYEIVAHSGSPDKVSLTEFSINDKVLATIRNQANNLVLSRQAWLPEKSGEYVIKARCQDTKAMWSNYAQARVTVGDKTPELPNLILPMRPNLPLLRVKGSQLFNLSVSTDHFYYRGTGCGTKQLTISIDISDSSGVDSAVLYYRLADQKTGATTTWSTLPMSGTGGSSGRWSRTINSESDIPGFSGYANSWFQFHIEAKNKAGIKTDSEIYYQKVSLSACTFQRK